MATINELKAKALATAVKKGFTDSSVLEDLMLMTTELAEAAEDFRAGKLPHVHYYETKNGQMFGETLAFSTGPRGPMDFEKPLKPCGIPSELADVIIRILHFSGKHGIDIERAVLEKMAFNETRPFKHGKVI